METCSGNVSCECALSNAQSRPTPGCMRHREDGTGTDCDVVSFYSCLLESAPGRRAGSVLLRQRPQQVMSHMP